MAFDISSLKSFVPGSGNFGSINQDPKLEPILSENYLISISSSYHGSVEARIPEIISMTINSEWKSLIGDNDASGSIIKVAIQEFLNKAPSTQVMTAQVWSGNAPIELTISLEFKAGHNPQFDSKNSSGQRGSGYYDVILPIKKLSKMALPSGGKGSLLLTPPGPRLFQSPVDKTGFAVISERGDGDTITIKVGKFLTFNRVIITNVSPEFSGAMSTEGYPMSAKVDVTFRTLYSLVTEQVDKMFEEIPTKVSESSISNSKAGGKSLLSYAMSKFKPSTNTA